jgi:hypothetical protein
MLRHSKKNGQRTRVISTCDGGYPSSGRFSDRDLSESLDILTRHSHFLPIFEVPGNHQEKQLRTLLLITYLTV